MRRNGKGKWSCELSLLCVQLRDPRQDFLWPLTSEKRKGQMREKERERNLPDKCTSKVSKTTLTASLFVSLEVLSPSFL